MEACCAALKLRTRLGGSNICAFRRGGGSGPSTLVPGPKQRVMLLCLTANDVRVSVRLVETNLPMQFWKTSVKGWCRGACILLCIYSYNILCWTNTQGLVGPRPPSYLQDSLRIHSENMCINWVSVRYLYEAHAALPHFPEAAS